ncbi:MAG: SDR family NAD(P)-dependent oxidoreductase [Bdellovibrionota bacterium]
MSRPLALITGGTSGIGLAVAKGLIDEHDLALVYRSNRARAEESLNSLSALNPSAKIQLFERVLDGHESCRQTHESVLTEFCVAPTVFIHCAGRGRPGLFVATEFSEQVTILNEHLISAMAMAHLVLPDMYRLKRGRIVLLGSIAARSPLDGQSAYAAAKGALESFTRALGREVFHRGITVNCVAPGLTDTPMTQELIQRAKEKDPSLVPGLPESVAKIIKLLCSRDGSEVCGKTIPVNLD